MSTGCLNPDFEDYSSGGKPKVKGHGGERGLPTTRDGQENSIFQEPRKGEWEWMYVFDCFFPAYLRDSVFFIQRTWGLGNSSGDMSCSCRRLPETVCKALWNCPLSARRELVSEC